MTDTPPPGPDDSFEHAATANGDGPADRAGSAAGEASDSGPTRDVDRAWAEVGERFADLGRRIKEQQQRRATPPDAATGTPSGDEVWDTPGDETAGGTRQHESGAARQVVDALDQAFSALGDTVRDAAFQREARGTLNALGAALGATFTELGQQLQQRFDQPEERETPPDAR